MQDNINKIISNSLSVDKDILFKNINLLISQIKIAIEKNKDAIIQANRIDEKNSNGFLLNFEVFENIFSNLKKEKEIYGSVTLSQKDNQKGIIYGKQIMDLGNVVVVTDGNPYITLEMALRNILAGNTVIIVNNGYMFGTNHLLIDIIHAVFEQFNVNKNLIQLFVTEEYDGILNNFANIDLVVCVGNHSLQQTVLNKSRNRTLISGYENFDLYIEDIKHLDFLNKIINTGLNIQVYIKKDTKIDCPNAILVDDLDEAIAQINYNGNKYSSSIFTDSTDNASKFIKEIKSKITTVNTSPTIERIFDFEQKNLVNEKIIIYPNNFNLTGDVKKVNLVNEEV